jgi:SpoVK/Ycf46/Vps4 family AAA+-type ATPase
VREKYQQPILSTAIHNQINDAITGFMHRKQWRDWGLDRLREQGVAILLHGPPGTGKTITAYYIAKKLHLSVVEVSLAEFGSQIPGQLARNIIKIFSVEQVVARNEHRHYPVILLDECDAMLVSRDKLGSNMMWMLEPINMLLSQISKYPGLVVLATNHAHLLDPALERRLLAKILVDRPTYYERLAMWKIKWPTKFPVQPTPEEFAELAHYNLTGAQIESAFLLWAGQQLRLGVVTLLIKDLINFIHLDYETYYSESGKLSSPSSAVIRIPEPPTTRGSVQVNQG